MNVSIPNRHVTIPTLPRMTFSGSFRTVNVAMGTESKAPAVKGMAKDQSGLPRRQT